MGTTTTYDNFPPWIVMISNLFSLLIYILGVAITFQLSFIAAVSYLTLILAFEYRLISKHCIDCYYWGKICGFGRGRVSSTIFKKGDQTRFCEKEMSWRDIIPDLLISFVPLIIAIVLIIIKFNIILLSAAILLIVLTTAGNGLIRGKLTCKYCKQREFGCPADKLFNKE